MTSRIKEIVTAAAAGLLLSTTVSVQAQGTYPVRPIRIVVALAPGGGVDTTARLMGSKYTEAWGQQYVAENRPGAGGTIAADLVAKAAPDGYTILVTSVGHAISPVFHKQLPFDVEKSFVAIARYVVAGNAFVVHPSVPVRSIKELIAFAKARPDELLFSTSGVGGPQHLSLELFNSMAGTRIVHVPYKGTAPSMLDLVGGRVSLSSASLTSASPLEKQNKLRMLAVVGAKRSAARPDLPTIAEAGLPGFENDVWYGAFGPAGVPRDVVARLSSESVRILNQKDVRDKLLSLGLEAAPMNSEEFTAFFRADVAKIAKIARTAGIKPE